MNSTLGFIEGKIEKELEFARARVAFLERKLGCSCELEKRAAANINSWSQIDHYVRLVEDLDQGVLVLDQSFRTVFINRRALSILGCARENFQARRFYKSLPDEERVHLKEVLFQQIRSGLIEEVECEPDLGFGNRVALRLKLTPIFGQDQSYEGVQLIITDITDERSVRKALERSEKLYQALFDGAGDEIFVHDPSGRIVDVNKVVCERTGFKRNELLEMNMADIYPAHQSLTAKNINYGSDCPIVKTEQVAKHGRPTPVELNSREVIVNGESKVLTIARDISERVEADRRNSIHRERMKAVYEMVHMNETSAQVYFEYTLRKCLELTGAELGFIAQLDGSGSLAEFRNWTSLDKFQTSGVLEPLQSISQAGEWRNSVVQRHPYYDNCPGTDHVLTPFSQENVRNYLAVPVREFGKVAVIAVLINKENGFDEEDIKNSGMLLEGMWNLVCKNRSEEQVRISLREKETLLKEVHHRVKNNMQVICSLLNLQTDYIRDPNDLQLIKNSIDRVRSMAYVHEQLYRSDDLSSIDFGQYISGLGTRLISSHGVSGKIDFLTNLEAVQLPIEQALPCGLIVNELITNAISHAFPENRDDRQNVISVTLVCNDGQVVMNVSDNGIGLVDGMERTGSLGHILVETLVQQIDGVLNIHSESGTKFELSFKLK